MIGAMAGTATVLAVIGRAIAVPVRSVTGRLSEVEKRITTAELAHQAHEDICSKRYAGIEAAHLQVVKVTDERHEEARERFDRIEDKIDRLLAR